MAASRRRRMDPLLSRIFADHFTNEQQSQGGSDGGGRGGRRLYSDGWPLDTKASRRVWLKPKTQISATPASRADRRSRSPGRRDCAAFLGGRCSDWSRRESSYR